MVVSIQACKVSSWHAMRVPACPELTQCQLPAHLCLPQERWQQQQDGDASAGSSSRSGSDGEDTAAATLSSASSSSGCPFAAFFGSGQPTPAGNSGAPSKSYMPFSIGEQ